MLHPIVQRSVERYLDDADRLLPHRVTACYVVGSVALDAYRPRRSDIDFVAVVEGELGASELCRLRLLHGLSGLRSASRAMQQGRSPATGALNGVFIRAADMTRPVSEIIPLAFHIGTKFGIGRPASDVSPVAWNVLGERGLAVRGPAPQMLHLDAQPELLQSWNQANLDSYWRPWATAVLRAPRARFQLRPRFWTAWGVLGPPRLHHTIKTGAVISKESAGEYALDTFSSRWHPLIRDAIAYRNRTPSTKLGLTAESRGVLTAEFVLHVVDDAAGLQESR